MQPSQKGSSRRDEKKIGETGKFTMGGEKMIFDD